MSLSLDRHELKDGEKPRDIDICAVCHEKLIVTFRLFLKLLKLYLSDKRV